MLELDTMVSVLLFLGYEKNWGLFGQRSIAIVGSNGVAGAWEDGY